MRYLILIIAIFIVNQSTFAQEIPSNVPMDGLAIYYPFSGNANDESGKGKNATVHGPTLTKDRFEQTGKAYSFDGSNDYISAPNNLKNFGIQDQFTLSSWFKVENDGSTYRMLMEDGNDYRYDSIYLGLRSSSDYLFAKLGVCF